MTWQPGQPIRTAQDQACWIEWKRTSKLAAQRYRRTQYRRIDYIDVSDDAAEVIDREASLGQGGDGAYSAVLNRIVIEWEAHRSNKGRNRK